FRSDTRFPSFTRSSLATRSPLQHRAPRMCLQNSQRRARQIICEVASLCPAKQFPTMTAFLELLSDVLIKRSGALAHHPAPHFRNKPNSLLALASHTTRNIGV